MRLDVLGRLRVGCGMTLTEIMIVLVVLVVIAGLAIPNYRRTVEQARASEAETNLRIILMGEKLYRLNNSKFWGPSGACAGAVCTDINNALNVDVTSNFYQLQVTTATAAALVAQAARIGGTKVYSINESGTLTPSGSF